MRLRKKRGWVITGLVCSVLAILAGCAPTASRAAPLALSRIISEYRAIEFEFKNLQQFSPPESYAMWFREAQTCSGLSRSYEAIFWQVADEIRGSDGGYAAGLWTPPDTITLHRSFINRRSTLKHEMLHYLLQEPKHPSPPFGVCNK